MLVLRMRACMRAGYIRSDAANFVLFSLFLVVVCSFMFTLYHYIIIEQCCLIIRRHGRHINRTRQGEQYTDTGQCPGHRTRTPWSPVRRWSKSRPGPIAATRLLDLDDGEPELPAKNSGRGGATVLKHIIQVNCFVNR